MKKNIIEHLRRFSSVPGKEKTSISQLTDNQLYELFLKIRNGESARAIARHVQKVWKINPKSSLHSVSQGVLKFKQRISHLLLFPSASSTDGVPSSDYPYNPGEDSTLEIMESIAKGYEVRIRKMISEEKETGVRYPFINRDVQALGSLRKAILKQKEWEATHEDPLERKRRERQEQNMERKFNALMDNLGDDGRERLVKAIQRMLEMAEEKSLIVYKKEDGTYKLIKPDEST